MRYSSKKRAQGVILLLIGILLTVMFLFPLFITFLSSLKSNSDILLGMLELPKQWMFSNYPEAVKTANALNTILHSLIIAISTLVLTIAVGFPAAYILARKSYKFIKPVYILFMAGVMVPVHCTLTSVSEMASTLGLKNSYIFLVLLYVAFNLSQAIFLFTSYIRGLDKGLDEAAKIDGCSNLRFIFRILLPLTKAAIGAMAVYTFINAWNMYMWPLLVTGDESMRTVQIGLSMLNSVDSQSITMMIAGVVLIILPSISIFILGQKQLIRGMFSGAVKG